MAASGLSPRGRGNRRALDATRKTGRLRSIPAWAGEPSIAKHKYPIPKVYPRVGGGTSDDNSIPTAVYPRVGGGNLCGRGSIEAKVYPRVGGGTDKTVVLDSTDEGLSPRGRGNRANQVPRHDGHGSIPAWAGEPPFREYQRGLIISLDG